MCRDIGGSDPERMAPPNVALYVQEIFANTAVEVQVIEDEAILTKEYPLLAAVNRAARGKYFLTLNYKALKLSYIQ